jgi:type IV pilus assembly protein PilW
MSHASQRHAQRGYTLLELSVAILIALFLMAGLLTLVMHTRNTSTTQGQLAQLQENERIAMTILANVVQEAGYFPDPVNNTATVLGIETANSAAGTMAIASGQGIAGQTNGAVPGDVLAARFAAPKMDPSGIIANTIVTCAGTTNTDAASVHWFTNVFQIGTVNGTTYLQCLLSMDGGAAQTINLVPGLYDMQISYGVADGPDNNVTKYVTYAAMLATDWAKITSVKVRLYFQLPQYGSSGGQVNSGATSSAVTNGTQYVERIIAVMNRTGVNT